MMVNTDDDVDDDDDNNNNNNCLSISMKILSMYVDMLLYSLRLL